MIAEQLGKLVIVVFQVTGQFKIIQVNKKNMAYVKYHLYKKQVSYDGGTTWEDTIPLETAPSGESIGIYSAITECENVPPYDMEGKLYVGKDISGTTLKSYDCSDEPFSNKITTTMTRSDLWEFKDQKHIYIGECAITIDKHAMRGGSIKSLIFYGSNGITFDGYSFYRSSIDSVIFVSGDLDIRIGGGLPNLSNNGYVFSEGSGDISGILSKTVYVASDSFNNGNFGDYAVFNKKVVLDERAFFWSSFTTITFNKGFSFGYNGNVDTIFFGPYGSRPTVVLNGNISDYPDNIVSQLTSYHIPVIDNTHT